MKKQKMGKYGLEDMRIISMFYCQAYIERYTQQGINSIFLYFLKKLQNITTLEILYQFQIIFT